MLSYRHGFHAGNHADVLKHLVLTELLTQLTVKDKPLWYIDTHAGAGIYSLRDGFAAEHGEADTGVERLWEVADLPAPIGRYLQLVRELNDGDELARYPGSAWLARALLRRSDRLWLHELHPRDHEQLAGEFKGRNIRVACSDGFAALRGLLPPAPRRCLVLIDPSYELKTDYNLVSDTLADALKRFATGVYAVWYPLLARSEALRLPGRLRALGAPRWLDVCLTVRAPPVQSDAMGMYGSGMFVINPPFALPQSLRDSMPELVGRLAQDSAAHYSLEYELP